MNKQSRKQLTVTKRSYLKQTDVPSASLEEGLRIPTAILDHYAGKPTSPLHVAKALNLDARGSQIRTLSGASIAFGLVEGGAQAATISITDLARRILRPKEENGDLLAKREAVLRPRIFGEFLRSYDSNPFPRRDIALNVLEELGVPRDKTDEVLDRIEASARSVGFIEEIKGKNYVMLQGTAPLITTTESDPESFPAADGHSGAGGNGNGEHTSEQPPVAVLPLKRIELLQPMADDVRRKKVYVTHGKNRDLVESIRKLLEYGELQPVVSVEKPSVSKPVPEKVMDDMRSCGAAIIHVDADITIEDKEGNEHVFLNPNVLIEIGGAMAFYGKRFVLLVREGVKLPSNLQGLYEVRYAGESLDAHATIKLLEAIKDIKNYALPTQSLDIKS
jgi:predicted nucleotide-binding protein